MAGSRKTKRYIEESQGWFGGFKSLGGLCLGVFVLYVATLSSSLDARHRQKQSHSGSVRKDRTNVGHQLPVFPHMKGGWDGTASRLESAIQVDIARKPGENRLHGINYSGKSLPNFLAVHCV